MRMIEAIIQPHKLDAVRDAVPLAARQRDATVRAGDVNLGEQRRLGGVGVGECPGARLHVLVVGEAQGSQPALGKRQGVETARAATRRRPRGVSGGPYAAGALGCAAQR